MSDLFISPQAGESSSAPMSRPEDSVIHKLGIAVTGLGVTVDEVIDSPILDWPTDAVFVENANMPYLKAYIASWLLAEKQFPYSIELDAVARLGAAA